jgi:hypothetical protein
MYYYNITINVLCGHAHTCALTNHVETTTYAGDCSSMAWQDSKGISTLQRKGLGKAIMVSGFMCPCCPHLLQEKGPEAEDQVVPLYSIDPSFELPGGQEKPVGFREKQQMGELDTICKMGYAWPGSSTLLVESGTTGDDAVWFTGADLREQFLRALSIFDVTHPGNIVLVVHYIYCAPVVSCHAYTYTTRLICFAHM